MDYVNICTTVFTPIEYSCVGLSEDDAIAKIGDGNVEVYIREFIPLEWSLSGDRQKHMAYAKVVVNKTDDVVLGIHYLGPQVRSQMLVQGRNTVVHSNSCFTRLVR